MTSQLTAPSTAQAWRPPASGQGRRAIIVGAGPAGALTALYLAQMNWNVSVYERRDAFVQKGEQEKWANRSRRLYNIVLTVRGLEALQQAGIELPADQSVALAGNVRHTRRSVKVGRQFSQTVSINRDVLAWYLVQSGELRYPQQITYHFGRRLQAVNFDQRIATFEKENESTEQSFDLLVGADGVFSTVRTTMAEQLNGFSFQQNRDDMTFKVCQLGKANQLSGAAESWGRCFHTWPSTQPVTLLASPNPDGSLTGVLILPPTGDLTFETLKTEADVEAFFRDKFADVFGDNPLPEGFAQHIVDQKTAYGGITTTCNTLHTGDRGVLVGDAGHSVWPSLGQGCNLALESCRVLAEKLAQHNGDLAMALSAYTAERKPDTDAAGRMSEAGFGGNQRAVNSLFLAKVLMLFLLSRLSPALFKPPAMLQLGEADVRYSVIEAQMQAQDRQLLGLLIGLIALAAALVGKVTLGYFIY